MHLDYLILRRFLLITLALSLAHTLDHVVRGDFNPTIHPEAYQSIAVSVIIYLIAGAGLYSFHRAWVGPKFWLMIGFAGLSFASIAHWLPAAEQSVAYIYNAYPSPWAGSIAVGILAALTVFLLITTLYSAYLSFQRG